VSHHKPYTITGLAIGVGLTRRGLLDYEEKGEFSHTITMAKAKVEDYAESHLFSGRNAAGAIFSLKNNYGWKDKTEQEVSGNLSGALVFQWADDKKVD